MVHLFIIGWLFLLSGERSTIARSEIQQTVTQYVNDRLDSASNDIILEFRTVPESIVVDRAEYSLHVPSTVVIPNKGYAGIPVEIRSQGKMLRVVICSVVIRRFEDVCVTIRDLDKYEIVKPIDIIVQRMETTNYEKDVLTSLISTVNTRTKRMVKAKTVLKNSMIEEVPAVNINDKVVVLVSTKNLSIAANGTAREEGKIGETIRIQRDGSREFLSGTVVGKQTVEIIVR